MNKFYWINMSGKREYEDIIHGAKVICGYHRSFKISSDRKQLRGRCSLTDKICTYDLPHNDLTCKVYKSRFK